MARATSALFVLILISTGASAKYRGTNQDGISVSVQSKCMQIKGSISIDAEQVPSSAEVIGDWSCDENPVTEIGWEGGKKKLSFFVTKDESTFQLDTLEYTEGGKIWCTVEILTEFKGIVGGEVVCSKHVVYRMKLCSPKSDSGKTLYGPAKQLPNASMESNLRDSVFVDVPPTDEIENTPNPSGGNLLTAEESSTSLPERTSEKQPVGISDESNTGGSAPPLIMEDGTATTERSIARGDQILITLAELSVAFTTDSSQPQRDYVTYCRVAPDLTVTLAVSGSVAAAAILAMLAVAVRVIF